MTKTCSTCKETKPFSDFNKRACNKHDGYQSRCRVCANKAQKEHYYNNKQYYTDKRARRRKQVRAWLQSFKEGKACLDCGETFPVVCMDFDHTEDNKLFNISRDGLSKSKKALLKEMAKCEIVCSNCHRIRTYNRKQNYSVVV